MYRFGTTCFGHIVALRTDGINEDDVISYLTLWWNTLSGTAVLWNRRALGKEQVVSSIPGSVGYILYDILYYISSFSDPTISYVPPVNYRPISQPACIRCRNCWRDFFLARLQPHLASTGRMDPYQSAYRMQSNSKTALLKVASDLYDGNGWRSGINIGDIGYLRGNWHHWCLYPSGAIGGLLWWHWEGIAMAVFLSHSEETMCESGWCSFTCVNVAEWSSSGIGVGTSVVLSFHWSISGRDWFVSYIASPICRRHELVSFLLGIGSTELFGDCIRMLEFSEQLVSNKWYLLIRVSLIPYSLALQCRQRQLIALESKWAVRKFYSRTKSNHLAWCLISLRLTFENHVKAVCRTCYVHIKSLRMLGPSLDTDTTETIGRSIMISRLDYCNSLLAFTSKQNIHRLQMVQNQLARVVSGSSYRQSAAPILLSLHWLHVQRRIEYKIVNMIFKSRMNSLPEYLSKGLAVHTSVRPIRSSLQNTYVVPRVRLEVAKQSFSYAWAKLWKWLPNVLWSKISYTEF